ncbi:unnamed protein product [Durusdinium trenchii]|uniref:Uncharacterized protein n=1 Tax=Durusdinium trenchii TaxID=1381693 RepID=A0ABP0SF41_9DINO
MESLGPLSGPWARPSQVHAGTGIPPSTRPRTVQVSRAKQPRRSFWGSTPASPKVGGPSVTRDGDCLGHKGSGLAGLDRAAGRPVAFDAARTTCWGHHRVKIGRSELKMTQWRCDADWNPCACAGFPEPIWAQKGPNPFARVT